MMDIGSGTNGSFARLALVLPGSVRRFCALVLSSPKRAQRRLIRLGRRSLGTQVILLILFRNLLPKDNRWPEISLWGSLEEKKSPKIN